MSVTQVDRNDEQLNIEAVYTRSGVARLAAAMRLGQQVAAEARSTALRYQLVSPWTNWLVVAEREAGEPLNSGSRPTPSR